MRELEISIDPRYEDNSFHVGSEEDIHVTITMNSDDFESMINDKMRFMADINGQIEELEKFMKACEDDKSYTDYLDKYIDTCEKHKQNYNTLFENFLDNFDYIKLDFDSNEEILEFLDKHPILHTKKIVKNHRYTISEIDELQHDADELSKYKNQLCFELEGNAAYADLETCIKTMEVIKDEAKMISEINLSPLENIAYVYDYVRNRVYTPSADGNIYSSRDLSSVLFGNDIVCVGYTGRFNAILRCMGFECYDISIRNYEGTLGHRRSGVYVKDDKYQVDGFYYFDPTFDSKKSENDMDYLKSYKYFAKTKSQIDNPSRIEQGLTRYFEFAYRDIEDIADTFGCSNLSESDEYAETGRNLLKRTKSIPNEKSNDNEELKDILKKAIEKYETIIPVKTLLYLIVNVRIKEYENNPGYFPLSVDEIHDIYETSEWAFDPNKLTAEDKLLYSIFGNVPQSISDKGYFMFEHEFYEFIYNNKIDKIVESFKRVKSRKK